eukprot:12383412-Heterocapsa_arctica.AAC.1
MDDPHHRLVDPAAGPPVAELDYTFMRSGATDDVLTTVLVGMLKEKGYGFACVTSAKGCGDKQALAAISRWLEEA